MNQSNPRKKRGEGTSPEREDYNFKGHHFHKNIQSLPLRIIKTEGGPTYVSRIPAEELTFDQKIAIYKLVYSPKLTESEQILISLLLKPEGEMLKETPEINRLVKIGRIKKEDNRYLLTRDGEIIAKGLQKMFSEEIR